MRRISLRSAAAFTLKNFATPIVFYVVFEEIGVKPAIAFAVGVALLQTVSHLIFKWRMTLYFYLATGFTVLFGSMDLMVHTPRYLRLEAFFQNFCVGVAFAITLFTTHSMIWRLAMSLPHEFRPKLNEISEKYLRNLTLIWAAYFFIKAFVFLYVAFRVDLGELYILRVTLGNASALLLISAEIFYRRRLWQRPQ